MVKNVTSIRLSNEELKVLDSLKEKYGAKTRSEVILLGIKALEIVDQSPDEIILNQFKKLTLEIEGFKIQRSRDYKIRETLLERQKALYELLEPKKEIQKVLKEVKDYLEEVKVHNEMLMKEKEKVSQLASYYVAVLQEADQRGINLSEVEESFLR